MHRGPTLGESGRHFEPCINTLSSAWIHRQSLPSLVKAWESADRVHVLTILAEGTAAKTFD